MYNNINELMTIMTKQYNVIHMLGIKLTSISSQTCPITYCIYLVTYLVPIAWSIVNCNEFSHTFRKVNYLPKSLNDSINRLFS